MMQNSSPHPTHHFAYDSPSVLQEEFNSISEGNEYITAAKLRELLVTVGV